jgi:hypothetical protein
VLAGTAPVRVRKENHAMLRRVSDLLGFTIHATDGDIGRVHDLYFDDQRWTVRYLVADTRHWLSGRRVLLSPDSVCRTDWEHREMVVTLSRAQIEESPSVETDKPVARQNAVLFRECYTLPYYWALGGFLWKPNPSPAGRMGAGSATAQRRGSRSADGDPHLRSTRLLEGYEVRAIDGDAGHVDDFVIDDASWSLRCVVVRTRHWRPGKRVLIPSDWIAWVSWIELTVHVDLPLHAIVEAPEYDPARPLTEDDEMGLSSLLGRPPRHRRDTTAT